MQASSGQQVKSSRRSVLAAAMATAGAIGIARISGTAHADDGDTLKLGEVNVSESTTSLNTGINERVLSVRNVNAGGKAVAIAAYLGASDVAKSPSAILARTSIAESRAIVAEAKGDRSSAISGVASGEHSDGVFGFAAKGYAMVANGETRALKATVGLLEGVGSDDTLGDVIELPAEHVILVNGHLTDVHGIIAVTRNRPALWGQALGDSGGIGVLGIGSGATGAGVSGVGGGPGATGVRATADEGVGLLVSGANGTITSASAGGIALEVVGRVKFRSAGAAAIPKGALSRTVSNLDVPANAKVIVTLNGEPGAGNGLRSARRVSATAIKVRLMKPATKRVRFSFFVIV